MAEYSTWPATDGPTAVDTNGPISLGLEFTCSGVTWARGLRVWRGSTGIGGPLTGRLYEVTGASTGDPVPGTDVEFDLDVGWLRADFPDPVELTPGGSYKVVVLFPANFNGTGGYWATGPGVGGVTNGPLFTPDTAQASGGQGTFAEGASLQYPTGTFNGGNYWVEVVVSDTLDSEQVAERGVTTHLDLASTVEVVKRATRLSGPHVALVAAADVMAVRRAAVATTLPLISGGAHVAHRTLAVTAGLALAASADTSRPGERHGEYTITPLPARMRVTQVPSRWSVLEV